MFEGQKTFAIRDDDVKRCNVPSENKFVLILSKQPLRNEFGRATTGRDDLDCQVREFQAKVDTRSSRTGNVQITSSNRQFLFDYKVINSALDSLLVSGECMIFIDFSIK